MYEGSSVELQMRKLISAEGVFDDKKHHCKVFKYDMDEDYIYLVLKESDLAAISLDAKYDCYITTRTEYLYCTGVVKERYGSPEGNILLFRIENGFFNYTEKGIINQI